jgi:cation:H+ antiporter
MHPTVDWVELVVALAVILLGAQLFTNGVEWIGESFGLSEGAVGSVLAAIGTALPETLLPLIAILAGGTVSGDEIGVGAILGAPFMLSTLAMCVLGASLFAYSRGGRRPARLLAEATVVRQDLVFFVAMYGAGVLAGLVHSRALKWVLAPLLLVAYGVYVVRHFRAPGERELETEATGEVAPLYLRAWWHRLRGATDTPGPPPTWASVAQSVLALALIVGGAKVFVIGIDELAETFHVPHLVFALLVAPVATELPEQFNGVIWIGRRKDTLAMGNVTGAMVFQSSFPVSVGLLLTPWHLSHEGLVAAVVALVAGAWLYVAVRWMRTLPVWALTAQATLYVGYVVYVVTRL